MKTPKRGLDRLTWDPRTESPAGLVAEAESSKRAKATITTATTGEPEVAAPPKRAKKG